MIDEAADADTYDLVLFYDDSDDDDDAYDSIEVDFDDATDYAAVWIDSSTSTSFDGTEYTDAGDKMIVGVYNNTGDDLSSLKVYDIDDDSV